MNNNNHLAKSFTCKATGKINVLTSPVTIHPPLDKGVNRPSPEEKIFNGTAIWDTGASATVITSKVVNDLGLIPISMVETFGVHGPKNVSVYMVGIGLPNQAGFRAVSVTECDSLAGGHAEVLIGMDIIGMGDFAVSNFQDKTQFTFRCPSVEHVDYVNQDRKIQNSNGSFKDQMSNYRKNSFKKR